jgi:hypothetical protein
MTRAVPDAVTGLARVVVENGHTLLLNQDTGTGRT